MTPLMQAIMAQLPRVREDEWPKHYKTAYGLKVQPDAHPLVAQADLRTIRQNLGVLYRQGKIVKAGEIRWRGRRIGEYAVAVPPTP